MKKTEEVNKEGCRVVGLVNLSCMRLSYVVVCSEGRREGRDPNPLPSPFVPYLLPEHASAILFLFLFK